MFETIKTTLVKWNQSTNDKQKLQHTYIVLLMIVVFLAGLVSLFNSTTSRQLIYIALALITTFFVNFVTWSLLKTTLLDKLPKPARTRTK